MAVDVIVIGASTSGLLAAWALARDGLEVVLVERSPTLAPVPRTLIVTSAIEDYLEPFGRDSIVDHVSAFELFTDGRFATVNLEKPDLVVERATLIEAMAEKACSVGVRMEFGCRFEGLSGGSEGINVEVRGPAGERKQKRTRHVVGADGVNSSVSQAAQLGRPLAAPLVQAIVKLPADLSEHVSRVWFRPQDTPYFFWLVPHGEEHGALGLIGENRADARHQLEVFLKEHDLQPLDYQAAQVPIYTGWRAVEQKIDGGKVFLVGDAAGHVKVSTVGGLVTGFRGAMGVVDAIKGKQRSRHLRTLRRELALHLWIRKVLHDYQQEDYNRLLDVLNETTKRSLGRHNRDEAGKILLQVARVRPRLMLQSLASAFSSGAFPTAHLASLSHE